MALFDKFYGMLLAVGETPKKTEKVKLFKQYAETDGEMQQLLTYALHPRVLFYLQKLPPITAGTDNLDTTYEEVINLFQNLRDRVWTGHAARDAIISVMSGLDGTDRIVVERILLKDLKVNAGLSSVNKAVPGLLPEYDVQLGHPYDDSRAIWPMIGQPKIDGLRVTAFVEADGVRYLSRTGNSFETLESLTPSIKAVFEPGTVLDGEVTSDSFLESISAVKRKKAKKDGEHNIKFYIFDMLSIHEFDIQDAWTKQKRRLQDIDAILDKYSQEFDLPKNISAIPWKLLANEDEAFEYFNESLDEGWEGLMVKDPDAAYVFKRTHFWMKIKPAESIDVEITGFQEGKKGGKTEGMLGAIEYEYGGANCKVGTGFSIELRKHLWSIRHELLGDLMEVEVMKREGKGMVRTQHARFKRLRTHKGEKA